MPSGKGGSLYTYECYVQALSELGSDRPELGDDNIEALKDYVELGKGIDPIAEYIGVKLEDGQDGLREHLKDVGLDDESILNILSISDDWDQMRECLSVPSVVTEYVDIFEAYKTYELILETDNEYREYLAWLSDRGTGTKMFDDALDEAQTRLDENKGVVYTLISEFADKILEVVPSKVFKAMASNSMNDTVIEAFNVNSAVTEVWSSCGTYLTVAELAFKTFVPEGVKGFEGMAKVGVLENIQDHCWNLAGYLQNEELTEENIVHIRQSYMTALRASRQMFEAQNELSKFVKFGAEEYAGAMAPQLKLINMKIQQLIASADCTENDSVEGKQEYTDQLKEIFADVTLSENFITLEELVTINKKVCTCNWEGDEWFFEIPQINLDSPEIVAINKEIMAEFSGLLHDCNDTEDGTYAPYYRVNCDYALNGDVLSVLIEAWDAYSDVSSYHIYNVSVSQMAPINDETLIAKAGMSTDEYRTHVKQALGSICLEFCSFLNDPYRETSLDEWFMCNDMLQDTISAENVDVARPFLGENGNLWVVGGAYIPAGGGFMYVTVDLNDYEMSPNYAESLDFEKPEELMRVEISWDGKNVDGDLLWLDADVLAIMDDGSWMEISGGTTYNEQEQPVAYCDNSWYQGSIVYYFYQLDGTFDFEVSVREDVADYLGLIHESGAEAVVTYPDGRSFAYTLDEGVYKSYTGHWFWAPFSIDHGTLVEYDASWINYG